MRTRAKKKHAYFQMDWNFDQSKEQFEINLIFRKDFFMDQTYMKKQPVLGLVVKMSLPMVISMLVNSLYNIVDSLFVAKISENAMTALSLVFPLQNLIGAIMIGFGVGINAVISFYLGAQDHKMADRSASQGLLLATLHGILLSIVCIAIMPSFLQKFTNDPDIISIGIRYSGIAFCFAVMQAWGLVFEKVYQAIGRMTLTMVCLLSGCVLNIILDPVLIFGIGPFPAMGIAGAAIATGLGQTLSAAMYLTVYLTQPSSIRFSLKDMKPDSFLIKKLYSIGIPASLNMALPSMLISVLNILLSAYSQTYVFVLGVYYKLQTFLYLPANGIIQGMRPLIGYNYGAREHKRVLKIYHTGLMLVAAIMAFGTALCWTIPGTLMGLFTVQDSTIRTGIQALHIISIGYLLSTISVITCGTLEALGKGLPSLIVSLCRYVILILPLAFLLSHLLGVAGVWHAFWLTETITAIISLFLYQNGIKKA